jgi:hypothetical protein
MRPKGSATPRSALKRPGHGSLEMIFPRVRTGLGVGPMREAVGHARMRMRMRGRRLGRTRAHGRQVDAGAAGSASRRSASVSNPVLLARHRRRTGRRTQQRRAGACCTERSLTGNAQGERGGTFPGQRTGRRPRPKVGQEAQRQPAKQAAVAVGPSSHRSTLPCERTSGAVMIESRSPSSPSSRLAIFVMTRRWPS